MTFIKKFILSRLLESQFHKGEASSMDFNYIEKKIFKYVLLVSLLVALMVSFITSLLSLSSIYFLSLGFSKVQLGFINVGVVASLIGINALVLGACFKKFFQRRKTHASLNEVPKMVTTCISEFIKGYKELEA